jgi:Delta-aminolevulinic acid dehydratase
MIMPVFVSEDATQPEPVSGMKGIFRYPVDMVGEYCSKLDNYGLGAFCYLVFHPGRMRSDPNPITIKVLFRRPSGKLRSHREYL